MWSLKMMRSRVDEMRGLLMAALQLLLAIYYLQALLPTVYSCG